jgi:hypothetical protein
MSNKLRSSIALSTKDKNYDPKQNTNFTTSSYNVNSIQSVFTSKNYSPIIWRSHRAIDNFSYATAAPLDFDNGTTIQDAEAILAKRNLNYALITSRSHKPEAHRFHIVIPFKRKIYTPEDLNRIILELRKNVFPTIDTNAMDAARFFYHSPDTAYYSSNWNREDYDPDTNSGDQIGNAWNDNLIVVVGKNKNIYANLLDEKTPIFCPFHEDSNPSAFVKRKAGTEERFIHCSTCGKTFWKIKPSLDQLCRRFWSHSTDIYEFVMAGESFAMSAVGKEKFTLFVNAITQAERMNAMKFLLDNKHIPHLRVVNHIGDPTIQRSDYTVDRETGTVTVYYTSTPVKIQDNAFIEEYLEKTFGTYKKFIKEWLAVFCYTNYRDLPTLILKGARGTGKNTFAEMIYSIFPSISQMWDAERSNFTPEAEKKLLIADETVCDDPEQYKLLKEYSGQKYVPVNKKYLPPYQVQNNINIIVLSNSVIPLYVSRVEIPSSEENNQFFVYDFKPFTGQIDPEMDKKLEERIGCYVRTELKTVFAGLKFDGNRYSIKVPITSEESGLFESNVTEEEGVTEKIVDKIIDNAKESLSSYGKFIKDGWVPIEMITDSNSATKFGPQKVIKSLKEQGYLELKNAEKKQYDKIRYRCHKMTDKLKKLL